MRVTSVEIHPADSANACILSFRDPGRQNPYNVKAILGLDADEIVPRFYGSSGSSNYYNLSLEKREIVVSIELNPRYDQDESPSSLRDFLYKLIASSRTGSIQIRFKDGDDVVAAVSGFVTKFETPLFSKNSEVQITVKCDEPMLKALEPVLIDVDDLDPEWTVLQDDVSTAPHGFTFEMNVISNFASFVLDDPTVNEWSFQVTPSGGFLTNDVIHFSSEYNNKYLYLVRATVPIQLADVILPGSVWPLLFPGENNFAFTNYTHMSWLEISHYPTYWGV